jgi:hypothetical protein
MVSERVITETVIHNFWGNIQEVIDKMTNLTGILFGLSKIYDALNHKILLSKLHAHRTRGAANPCFKSIYEI